MSSYSSRISSSGWYREIKPSWSAGRGVLRGRGVLYSLFHPSNTGRGREGPQVYLAVREILKNKEVKRIRKKEVFEGKHKAARETFC